MFATLHLIELLVARPASQKRTEFLSQTSGGVLEGCLELLSNLKDQFAFVVDEFSEFVRSRKSLFS